MPSRNPKRGAARRQLVHLLLPDHVDTPACPASAALARARRLFQLRRPGRGRSAPGARRLCRAAAPSAAGRSRPVAEQRPRAPPSPAETRPGNCRAILGYPAPAALDSVKATETQASWLVGAGQAPSTAGSSRRSRARPAWRSSTRGARTGRRTVPAADAVPRSARRRSRRARRRRPCWPYAVLSADASSSSRWKPARRPAPRSPGVQRRPELGGVQDRLERLVDPLVLPDLLDGEVRIGGGEDLGRRLPGDEPVLHLRVGDAREAFRVGEDACRSSCRPRSCRSRRCRCPRSRRRRWRTRAACRCRRSRAARRAGCRSAAAPDGLTPTLAILASSSRSASAWPGLILAKTVNSPPPRRSYRGARAELAGLHLSSQSS